MDAAKDPSLQRALHKAQAARELGVCRDTLYAWIDAGVIPPEAIKTFTGKAGTMIFCDTSGLHQGGYATGKERIMSTFGYYSHASLWPVELEI